MSASFIFPLLTFIIIGASFIFHLVTPIVIAEQGFPSGNAG